MKQHKLYNLWVFCGAESLQREFRGVPVSTSGDKWYVGHRPGSEIEAGWFADEDSAMRAISSITDTSGT